MCDGFSVIMHAQSENMYISCETVAEMMYNYPIKQLLSTIHEEGLNGKEMIDILKDESENVILTACGWAQDEVEQIKLLLLREMTLPEEEFKQRISKRSAHVQHILNEIAGEMDIEQVQYNIKHNCDTGDLSVVIRDLVDEYGDSNCELIQRVYKDIAQCFSYNEPYLAYWVCCNCGNGNFNEDTDENQPLFSCTLCGISQLECIIRKIRNEDTFISVHHTNCTPRNLVDDDSVIDVDW
eukprot:410277_1